MLHPFTFSIVSKRYTFFHPERNITLSFFTTLDTKLSVLDIVFVCNSSVNSELSNYDVILH